MCLWNSPPNIEIRIPKSKPKNVWKPTLQFWNWLAFSRNIRTDYAKSTGMHKTPGENRPNFIHVLPHSFITFQWDKIRRRALDNHDINIAKKNTIYWFKIRECQFNRDERHQHDTIDFNCRTRRGLLVFVAAPSAIVFTSIQKKQLTLAFRLSSRLKNNLMKLYLRLLEIEIQFESQTPASTAQRKMRQAETWKIIHEWHLLPKNYFRCWKNIIWMIRCSFGFIQFCQPDFNN